MTSISNILLAIIAVINFSASGAFHTVSSPLSTHSLAGRHKIFSHPRSLISLSQSSGGESESYEESVQIQESAYEPPTSKPRRQNLDPLVASLTRIDEPPPANTPTTNVPLLGEIPADGNLALLVPAAGIAVLGLIFSIVVAFNSGDAIVQELNKVEVPKMEYTPTVVEEGVCRGLCSSQESDLEGLRGFMQSLGK